MCYTYIRSCSFRQFGSAPRNVLLSSVQPECDYLPFSQPLSLVSLCFSFLAGKSETIDHDSFAKCVTAWQDSLLWYALLKETLLY